MKDLANKIGSYLVMTALGASVLGGASTAQAEIVYGNFAGTTIDYINVKEDDGGFFQSPIVVGDALVFNPTGFEAQSTGGGIDLVDGTLAFIIEAHNGFVIDELSIEEAGFYSLLGVGTDATKVLAGFAATVQILEVNGLPFAGPLTQLNFNSAFVDLDLINDGPALLQPWQGAATYDIAAAADLELGITDDITKVSVTFNNQLVAISENGSVAFIDKKGFRTLTLTVPEPGTMILLISGGTLIGLRRRTA